VRRTPRSGLLILLCVALSGPGCRKADPPPQGSKMNDAGSAPPTQQTRTEPARTGQLSRSVPREAQPDRLAIRLVVIGCDGFGLADLVHRTPAEAQSRARLAADALRAGGDLDEIVARFSDDPDKDRTHGVFLLRNYGVPADSSRSGELTPDRLPGVAKVAFTLSPGDVAIVEPDAKEAPLGYYVFLRER